MSFAILRTAKLKTAAAIRGVGGHNARTRETDNANPDKENEILIDGGPDLHATVMARIKDAGAKARSNSVLAQEVIMSASPEFFRPDNPAKAGEWSEERKNQFRDHALAWLDNEFGSNVMDCRLHLDESSPHMHAVVVPLVPGKTPDKMRLCARDRFSKKTLQQMQTSYAKELKSLHIKRGIPGSQAKHTDIKQYYRAVNAPAIHKTPSIPAPDLMLREKDRQKYANKVNLFLKDQFEPLLLQARHAQISRKKEKEYKATAQHINAQKEAIEAELKTATDSIRDIPLPMVLQTFGLEMSPLNKELWIGGGYRIKLKKNKFFDHCNKVGGGGAIDLVKHLNQCNFKTAVAWLGHEISLEDAARALRAEAERTAKELTDGIDVGFQPPVPSPRPESLEKIKQYLKEVRKLDPDLTDSLIARGRLYATEHRGYTNIVFLCTNSDGSTGAEIHGLNDTFSGMAQGSKKKLGAFSLGDSNSKHVVFVKSAIDAISYKRLHPEPCSIISTAGATTTPQFAESLKEFGWDFTVAYGNDEDARAFASKLIEQYPDVAEELPRHADWNEDLRRLQEQDPEFDCGLDLRM